MAALLPNIPRERIEAIGTDFLTRIEMVEEDRQELKARWVRALENYEGKAPPRDFPWPNASNAVVPLVPTHVDALYARLLGAAVSQDPIWLVLPGSSGEVLPGLTVEEYARNSQDFSKAIESSTPIRELYEQTLMTMTKYGDAIIYVSYEQRIRKISHLSSVTGEYTHEQVDLLDRPEPRVIHPKDFFIPVHETDIDLAPWCGFRFYLDAGTLRRYKKQGYYDSQVVDALFEDVGQTEKPYRPYFQDQPDGSILAPDEVKKRQDELVGVSSTRAGEHQRPMARIFARYDIDEDGVEEEIVFDLDLSTGLVPRLEYYVYEHRERPFTQYRFLRRDGNFYSIGVPEMLENLQGILNTIQRQIEDNNTVQNTKLFLARKNSGILKGTRIYPMRLLFTDNIETDFKVVDLAGGSLGGAFNILQFHASWAERRTGITDFNLGQERNSRTPATTTLAVLQESNKKIDIVVRNMRTSMERTWGQVLSLYAQYKPRAPFKTMGPGGLVLEDTWNALSTADLRSKLLIRAQASTQNLNRGVQRQEATALLGQATQIHTQILTITQMYTQTPDPMLKALLLAQLKSLRRMWTRVLDTYDIKDQDDINPDVESMVKNAVIPPAIPPNAGGQVAPPPLLPGGVVSAGGPPNPVGRPQPGIPRVFSGAGEKPGPATER